MTEQLLKRLRDDCRDAIARRCELRFKPEQILELLDGITKPPTSEHCPTCGAYIGDAETAEMYSMADGEPIKKIQYRYGCSIGFGDGSGIIDKKPKLFVYIEELKKAGDALKESFSTSWHPEKSNHAIDCMIKAAAKIAAGRRND